MDSIPDSVTPHSETARMVPESGLQLFGELGALSALQLFGELDHPRSFSGTRLKIERLIAVVQTLTVTKKHESHSACL